MSDISRQIGARIRLMRKETGMTLQQLAAAIHKSRASVSKYETGEITLDVETLHDIAAVLGVPLSQLTAVCDVPARVPQPTADTSGKSPFYRADRLYFYFYDGRYKRLKDGVIDIHRDRMAGTDCAASLSISAVTPTGRSSRIDYDGKVVYSDMLIRFSFVNRYNTLEEDLLYIFNPLELRDSTYGLLCGISSADLKPCAFKCIVSLTPIETDEELRGQLLVTRREMHRWQKLNMWMIDNNT